MSEHAIADPSLFDDDSVLISFYVEVPHPEDAGQKLRIPCRELDPGECFVFILSAREQLPEVEASLKGKAYEDMTKSEKEQHLANLKVTSAVDDEMFTEIALLSIVTKGWTRERVARLPRSARKEIYDGATVGLYDVNPAVEAFPEKDSGKVSRDAESVSGGVSGVS